MSASTSALHALHAALRTHLLSDGRPCSAGTACTTPRSRLHHSQELAASAGTAHSLYVIRKQEQILRPPQAAAVKPLCFYYVLDGVVYEAPTELP